MLDDVRDAIELCQASFGIGGANGYETLFLRKDYLLLWVILLQIRVSRLRSKVKCTEYVSWDMPVGVVRPRDFAYRLDRRKRVCSAPTQQRECDGRPSPPWNDQRSSKQDRGRLQSTPWWHNMRSSQDHQPYLWRSFQALAHNVGPHAHVLPPQNWHPGT